MHLGELVRGRSVFSFILILFACDLGFAQTSSPAASLGELALYYRCYAQMTSLQPDPKDTLSQNVANGNIKAVDACMTIFNSAALKSNGSSMVLKDPNDLRSVSVLATFHRLHASWFYIKDFPTTGLPGQSTDMKDLFDSTTPAFYFTRALLGSGIQANDPLRTHDFLSGLRSNMSVAVGPESGHPLADYVFTSPFYFAPTGALTGIQAVGDTNLSYATYPGAMNPTAGSLNITANAGGGFMGNSAYLNLNLPPINHRVVYQTDGAAVLPRRYGKAIFKDVLCRDLPVIRQSDAVQFVDVSSPTAFRVSSSCTQCHASHDRISMVARGLYIKYIGFGDPSSIGQKRRGGNFVLFHPVAKPAETSWPSTPDLDFYQRPPTGELYFRSFTGDLIDEKVQDLDDLGAKLAETDDYYACLAKRYYQYFTGINVNTGDINDPDRKIMLGTADTKNRAVVVNLAKALKQNQSLPTLIKSILSLDSYRRVDFGAGQ